MFQERGIAPKTETYLGKEYYQLEGLIPQGTLGLYVQDDRTVVAALEPTLKKMLTPNQRPSPLRGHLPTLDLNHDFVAFIAMDQVDVAPGLPTVRQALAEVMKQNSTELPPEFASLPMVPDQLKSVMLAIDLNGSSLLKLDVEADNGTSAKSIFDLASAGKAMIDQNYPTFRKMAEQGPMAPPPEVANAILAVADDLVAGLDLQQNGTHVVLNVKMPRGLADLPMKLLPFIQQMMQAPPIPPPPVEPAKPVPGNIKGQAVDWIRKNNVLGPMDQLVTNVEQQLAKNVGPKDGFLYMLGPQLMKTGKPTVLTGWGNQLFVHELTPEQAKRAKLEDFAYALRVIFQPATDQIRETQDAILSNVSIEGADALDPTKKITGTVSYQRTNKAPNFPSLRVIQIVEGGQFSTVHHFVDDFPADKGQLAFSFPEVADSNPKHQGALITILELVDYPNEDRQGRPSVLSNPVAVLLNVVPPK
jgi:hypothetical protein